MKLTYIYHSGYAIEGDDFTIIIDYYKDSSEKPGEGIVHKELLKRKGKLYVLCTHSHHDHFNREILKWKWEHPNVIYIFSKDILKARKAKDRDAIYLDKGDTYKDETLFIQAFGSTDLGVSFLIKVDNKTIFHAGDLNNWHWNEESTPEEIQEAENFYENELDTISQKVNHIDLAMFPVDPRLGKDYMKGAEQFISKIKTDIFAPMHFGEEYEKANSFVTYATSKGTKFIPWKHRGESISL